MAPPTHLPGPFSAEHATRGIRGAIQVAFPTNVVDNGDMTSKVQEIADQVRSLPKPQREELLSWLAEFELNEADEWDQKIDRDAADGGRLDQMLQRVRQDITEGRTRPLDEVLGDS